MVLSNFGFGLPDFEYFRRLFSNMLIKFGFLKLCLLGRDPPVGESSNLRLRLGLPGAGASGLGSGLASGELGLASGDRDLAFGTSDR